MVSVNVKQQMAIALSAIGHNVFVTGQAGTGKAATLQTIANNINQVGEKNVHITCTTGMATMQFKNFNATTIHYWSGIADGRYTDNEMQHNLLHNEAWYDCKERIKKTDVIIIDELSMLSKKNFDQINFICQTVRQVNSPFGGIQVIAGGSFKQLPPVPNLKYLDSGEYAFMSEVWPDVFPPSHCIVLDEVMRTNNVELITAVHELENGSPSDETENFLKQLNRKLLIDDNKVMKIFATRQDVDMMNYDYLNKFPGVEFKYNAVDKNVQRVHHNKLTVPKVIRLKQGVPVILVKNLNVKKGLVNGRKGVVKDCHKDFVTVNFDGNYEDIHVTTFSLYDPLSKKVMCERTQIPLLLGFAITVHKAQGMTLNYVEVDCTTMFCAGQMAVAIGRARTISGLRILSYNPNAARLQHNEHVKTFHTNLQTSSLQKMESINTNIHTADYKCCKNKIYEEVTLPGADYNQVANTDNIEGNLTNEQNFNTPATNYQPPKCNDLFTFNINAPVTELQENLVKMYDSITSDETFINFWHFIVQKIENHTDMTANKNTKEWNNHTSKYNKLFQSDDLMSMKNEVFLNYQYSDTVKNTLFFQLMSKAREVIIQEIAKNYVSKNIKPSDKPVIVDSTCMAVIRYVAGYTIGRIKKKCHSVYATRNDANIKNRWDILRSLTVQYSEIIKTTKYPDSMTEITRRSTSTGYGSGLVSVNDKCFEFFTELYKTCCNYISTSNMDVYQYDLFHVACSHVTTDDTLMALWFNLHTSNSNELDDELQTIILISLFEDIVESFITILFKDCRKKLLEEKGRKKTQSLRKELKSYKPNNTETVSTCIIHDEVSTECLKVDYPCGKCGEDCVRDSIQCSLCNTWFHYKCVNLKGDEIFITNTNMDYYCPNCDVPTEKKKRKSRKRKLND